MQAIVHCKKLTECTYLVNTERGFRNALRIELAKGDLRYSPTVDYVFPKVSIPYPKVIRFDITTKLTIQYFSVENYRIKLLKQISAFDRITNRSISE